MPPLPIRFILVRPKEPGNVGSAARAMKNFAFDELYLVSPQRPINAHAYALASHAGDVLDKAVFTDSLTEAITGCTLVLGTTARPRKDKRGSFTAREAAQDIAKRDPNEKIAIIFGPEDWGLSNEDLAQCMGYVQIPTAEYSSLNLAQAVQVMAYEFYQHTQATGIPRSEKSRTPAPREMLELFYEQLREMLLLIGYTDQNRQHSTMRLMRGIFDKAAMTKHETSAIRGMLRQMRWAMRKELLEKEHDKPPVN